MARVMVGNSSMFTSMDTRIWLNGAKHVNLLLLCYAQNLINYLHVYLFRLVVFLRVKPELPPSLLS